MLFRKRKKKITKVEPQEISIPKQISKSKKKPKANKKTAVKKKIKIKKVSKSKKVTIIKYKPGSDEAKLLAAKTPAHYIDISLKVKVIRGKKATISRQWFLKTGFTNEDLIYARNRHPYWKAQKMQNSYERNKEALRKHNYSISKNKKWTEKELIKFLSLMNTNTNIELAKKHKRSLASINSVKRRLAMGTKILELENKKMTAKRQLSIVLTGEKVLRSKLQELIPKKRKSNSP